MFRTDFLDGASLHSTAAVIDDYRDTAGHTRDFAENTNHRQDGDPAKLASAIADVAAVADRPVRLQLGADCVERVSERLDAIRAELEAWRPVAEATAFDR